MIRDEYSPYKIVHHQDKLRELAEGKQPDPIQIHLIPTNRCNQNCTFCAYRLAEYTSNQNFKDQDMMPTEKLLETIDSCKDLGIRAIQFTGGGEPLTHPAIEQAFRRTLDHGLDLALVSNGMALNDQLIDMLAHVSWVRISVDAARRQTYSLIRRVKNKCFDTVLENIQKLARIKTSTVLGVGFVVNRENYREIYDAARIFKDLGIDNIRISAAFTTLGLEYFDGIFEEAKDLAQRAKEDFQDEDYTVFNLFNDRISDLFTGVQNYDFCPMKDLVPYVGADQKVYTCCMLAYNDLGYIGSIEDQSLAEMWHGESKRQFFEKHTPRVFCQLPCMFENKNTFVNYCIKTDAKHTNFI